MFLSLQREQRRIYSEGINLVIEPGQTVAVLGATGAGKSTVINLIPRFYDVSAGRIKIDGSDLRIVKEDSLLTKIAIVPKRPSCFPERCAITSAMAIRQPVTMTSWRQPKRRRPMIHHVLFARLRYTHRATRREPLRRSKTAHRHCASPAHTPKILILDDSTSAVDVETETKIQDALEAQAFKHTSLSSPSGSARS